MNPPTMTAAEFRTAFQSLGLTVPFVAQAIGVSVQRVHLYASTERLTDVPWAAAQVMLDCQRDFQLAADRLAAEIQSDPEVECLTWQTSESTFWEAVPELQGWPLRTQSMLFAEVQRLCETRLRIEYPLSPTVVAA